MPTIPGTKILFKLACPTCGKLTTNWQADNSDFFILQCFEDDCGNKGLQILVERRTGQILTISAVNYGKANYDTNRYEQYFPVLANEKGEQVWPEVKK